MKISLMMVVLNEEIYLPRALDSIKNFVDEIIIIDGGSHDRTCEIANGFGAKVLTREWDFNLEPQCNLGIEACSNTWIFNLDADELPSKPLKVGLREIANTCESTGICAVGIPRLNFIDAKLVESPGFRGLDPQYRLFRRNLRFRNRVHCELHATGVELRRVELDLLDGHYILHVKDLKRHLKSNEIWKKMGG